jgi:hypothetical protein
MATRSQNGRLFSPEARAPHRTPCSGRARRLQNWRAVARLRATGARVDHSRHPIRKSGAQLLVLALALG